MSLTCATNGTCKVRDIGPGGGIVFYVHPGDPFASPGSTCNTAGANGSSTCTYLEAAIANGTTTSTWTPDTTAQWGCYNADVMTTAERLASLEIGQGRANTKIITDKTCVGTDNSVSAASIAKAYNGGGKDDWFLPSRKELDALCDEFFKGRTGIDYSQDTCMGSGTSDAVTSATNGSAWSFAAASYWSSSEGHASGAWFQNFGSGGQGSSVKYATSYVRPVRAF